MIDFDQIWNAAQKALAHKISNLEQEKAKLQVELDAAINKTIALGSKYADSIEENAKLFETLAEYKLKLWLSEKRVAKLEKVREAYIKFRDYTDNMADEQGNMETGVLEEALELEVVLEAAIKNSEASGD